MEQTLGKEAELRHSVMIPAYDDPILWEGHGSMISEISQQLDRKPDAIFCSVGGGGLLGGIITGCEKSGWSDGTSELQLLYLKLTCQISPYCCIGDRGIQLFPLFYALEWPAQQPIQPKSPVIRGDHRGKRGTRTTGSFQCLFFDGVRLAWCLSTLCESRQNGFGKIGTSQVCHGS